MNKESKKLLSTKWGKELRNITKMMNEKREVLRKMAWKDERRNEIRLLIENYEEEYRELKQCYIDALYIEGFITKEENLKLHDCL